MHGPGEDSIEEKLGFYFDTRSFQLLEFPAFLSWHSTCLHMHARTHARNHACVANMHAQIVYWVMQASGPARRTLLFDISGSLSGPRRRDRSLSSHCTVVLSYRVVIRRAGQADFVAWEAFPWVRRCRLSLSEQTGLIRPDAGPETGKTCGLSSVQRHKN